MGNDFCRFLIGSEERIQVAEFWISSGARANEIAERFESGEVPADSKLSLEVGAA
jgi:uncharacterized protein